MTVAPEEPGLNVHLMSLVEYVVHVVSAMVPEVVVMVMSLFGSLFVMVIPFILRVEVFAWIVRLLNDKEKAPASSVPPVSTASA